MKVRLVLFSLIVAIVSGCNMGKKPEQAPPEEAVKPPVEEVKPVEAVKPEPVVLKPVVNDGTWVVTASSQEAEFAPGLAVDGSQTTRWSSEFKDNQWWLVDFGRKVMVGQIALHWETAYTKNFKVFVSDTGGDWKEVFSTTDGVGGTTEIVFEPRPVRQVRIDMIQRATEWGNSLLEVEFNGTSVAASSGKMEATASSGSGDYAAQYAIDGKWDTRWSSNFGDSEWWQVHFEKAGEISGLKINWETAFAEKYEIAVSMDGQQWQKVYDVPEGDGRTDILFFKPVEAQYLRIQCLQRGTGWGNSIYEAKFYNGEQAPVCIADSSRPDAGPELAFDGDPATAWHSAADGVQKFEARLPEKFGLGGLELKWGADFAKVYAVELSADGAQWSPVFSEKGGNGEKDYVFFPSFDAQYVRIVCRESSAGQGYALAQIELKGGEEQATPIRAYQAKARDAKLGWFPMWLTRQQEFWTVVGLPDDNQETLIGETGTIEPHKGDFSVTPFVLDGNQFVTWADVKLDQRLEDDYLPLPSTRWTSDRWVLDVSAVASGPVGQSLTAVRYRFINTGSEPFSGKLALALRPVQLNPIWQHGGMSPINEAECTKGPGPWTFKVNGLPRIAFLTQPAAIGVSALPDGEAADFLSRGEVPPSMKATDSEGKTGGGVLFDLSVPAGGTSDVVVAYMLHDQSKVPDDFAAAPAAGFEQVWSAQRALWDGLLNQLTIDIPEPRLIKVMKSNVGYVMVNRDAPWFKPGSRNYNHSWMRDGALTGVAMLRMGRPDLVKQFVESFFGFVGDNGWVPFLIMEEGKPNGYNPNLEVGEGHEYDSQGEFPFIVRQYYDYTGDRAMLEKVYPKVEKALEFARGLRRLRMTDAYKNEPAKKEYYGILPASNSHEGYFPAKHSYWDDLWVIKGFKDGAYLATVLGKTNDAVWMKAEAEDLRKCTYESMVNVSKRAGINQIPGCVEFGDMDATSTSVGIMACDETDFMPQPELKNTFDNYYKHISKRFNGERDTFTPYEARNVDVFIRIGQRDRALKLLRYFVYDSTRPSGWNHLAEVVHEKYRAPSYIGDMPHTWCGSDLINATRSIFAYELGDQLVLAAGIDPAWLDKGVAVKNLFTQYGAVDYRIRQENGEVKMTFEGAAKPAGGFIVPLPESLTNLSAEINGQPAQIVDGKIRFNQLPAQVRLFTPAPPPAAEPEPVVEPAPVAETAPATEATPAVEPVPAP